MPVVSVPAISVIIPTFNRPARLASCLEALARQDFKEGQFEVIVVDDGGYSDLESVIEPLRRNLDVTLIKQANTGPAGARNTGVANANGDFLAFMDDDCAPDRNWLAALTRHLQDHPFRLYGGITINGLEHNIYSTASQSMIDYLYGYHNDDPEHARFLASNNVAVSRNMYETVGGFDTSFPGACGEDREFCDRWLHLGHQITLARDARMYHQHELNLRTFWKQHFNYGTGAKRFWECKAERDQGGLKTEPMEFYINLLIHPWRQKLQRPFSLSLLMVLSQIANTTGFVWASISSK